jgi:hypothetical protein
VNISCMILYITFEFLSSMLSVEDAPPTS